MQELKHLNLSVYRRVLSLMKNDTRSYIFFPNELCVETCLQRSPGESPNDFNDRSIRKAAEYFSEVLEEDGELVLITNDCDNQVCIYTV